MPILTPVEHNPFAITLTPVDDDPFIKKSPAGGAQMPMREMDANEFAARSMGVNPDAPGSYGAGRHRIYSPNATLSGEGGPSEEEIADIRKRFGAER